MMEPRFSFVLPAYKGDYLHEAIQSILHQSYKDFELIIVDDCSPDDLISIVDKYNDERISYHRNSTNIGGHNLVKQWNISLSYASGQYIILASDDDRYRPDFLSTISSMIDKHPDYDVFRPMISQIDDKGDISHTEDWSTWYKETIDINTYIDYYSQGVIGSGIPQYVFKRDSLLRVGGFIDLPKAWFSDDATVIALAGEKGLVLVDKVLFEFRIWGKSISGSTHQDMDQFYQKIQAASMFVKKTSPLITDHKVKEKVLFRTRQLTAWQLYYCSPTDCVRALHYMKKTDCILFPYMWRCKKLSGYFKFKVLHYLTNKD